MKIREYYKQDFLYANTVTVGGNIISSSKKIVYIKEKSSNRTISFNGSLFALIIQIQTHMHTLTVVHSFSTEHVQTKFFRFFRKFFRVPVEHNKFLCFHTNIGGGKYKQWSI